MTTRFGERVRDGLEMTGQYAATNQRQVFAIVVVTALISLGVGLSGVQMSMGMTLYINDDSQTADNWESLKDTYNTGNNIFVLVESDQLYDPETIRAIDRLDQRYGANVDSIQSVTSLADIVKQGAGGEIPETEAGVRAAVKRVEQRGPAANEMVTRLTPEAGTTIILASYGDVDRYDRGAFLPERGADVVYSSVKSETAFAATPPSMSTTITGQPVFENAAFGLMLPEMIALFGGAFTLIFVVVYLVMRETVEKGWHVILPLGTAMTALLYMMGAMGVLGYDFNAIMLGVMPIALGLGIDYSLQIHSRYVEERQAGHNSVDAIGTATRTTGRALLIAMGTTVVGLGSLLVSAVPPVRQFGVTSAVAVLAAMILAVTVLPALLVRFDRDGHGTADTTSDSSDDWLQVALHQFTSNITGGRPVMTLGIAILLVSGGVYAYPQVEPKQEMMDFWPQDLDEKNDIEELSETVESPKVVYVMIETDRAYTPETFRDVATYQRLMIANEQVNAVQSPVTSVQMATKGPIPSTQSRLTQTLDRLYDTSGMASVRDPDETPSTMVLSFYVDDIEGESV
ncbi:MAG: putative exporters of the RND superfamily, partial [Haloquadratum sp. J07HQX50]